LGILAELKPLINEAHEKYVEQQARAAKRRQQIKTGPPAPPVTLKQEREKVERRKSQEPAREDEERNGVQDEPWDLLKQMQGIKFVSGRPQVQETPIPPRQRSEFKYPSVSQQQPLPSYSSTESQRFQQLQIPSRSPILPPKQPLQEQPLPPKLPTPESLGPPTPAPTPPPAQDSDSRQFAIGCTLPFFNVVLSIIAYLENGQDLRSVFIPSTLRERFLKIAEPNTARNLETCGILCGVLVRLPPPLPTQTNDLAQQCVYNRIPFNSSSNRDVRFLYHNRRGSVI